MKVPVNELGRRIGDGHHRCTIPDAVVVRIRDLREYEHVTIPEIARRLGVAAETVRAIVYYRRRAQIARDYIEVDQ